MAKLNGVFVSEDATEIIYEGIRYVKSDEDAVAGNIVRMDVDVYSYLLKGAFYAVNTDSDGDDSIIDEDGDEIFPDYDFTVYKPAEQPVEAPARHSVKYRVVRRKARVGERIRIVNEEDIRYKNGDEFTVDRAVYGAGLGVWSGNIYIRNDEYVVLEPITAQEPAKSERLAVGDYAKVIDGIDDGYAKFGDIGKLIAKGSAFDFKFRKIDDDSDDYTLFNATHLARATDAEAANAMAEAKRQAEESAKKQAKWSAIGRKVGELKVGDIVRCTGSNNGHPVGTVGEVVYDALSLAGLRVKANGILKSHLGQMELVVPVEKRFDRQ